MIYRSPVCLLRIIKGQAMLRLDRFEADTALVQVEQLHHVLQRQQVRSRARVFLAVLQASPISKIIL